MTLEMDMRPFNISILFLLSACATSEDQDSLGPLLVGVEGDAAAPPPAFDLRASSYLQRGEIATFSVSGATPNAEVLFLATTAIGGAPYCIDPNTCLAMPGPVRRLARLYTNAQGDASIEVRVPRRLTAEQVTVQAIEPVSLAQSDAESAHLVNTLTGSVQGRVSALGGTLAGASVTMGALRTTTVAYGAFTLRGVPWGDGQSLEVSFNAAGADAPVFSTGHLRVDVRPEQTASVEATLLEGCSATFDPTAPAPLQCSGSKVEVALPADGIVDEATGASYVGPVHVELIPLDPNRPGDLEGMPGDMHAASPAIDGEPTMLQSAGAVEVRMTDPTGQPLQIGPGHAATLTFRTPVIDDPSSYAAFHYDEEIALWVEGEPCTSQTGDHDGDGVDDLTWSCSVSHFSWWNLDARLQNSGCVEGMALFLDPQTGATRPARRAAITGPAIGAVGANLGATASEEGAFCVSGPPGREMALTAMATEQARLYVGNTRTVTNSPVIGGPAPAPFTSSCRVPAAQRTCTQVDPLIIPMVGTPPPLTHATGRLLPEPGNPFAAIQGVDGTYELWGRVDPWGPEIMLSGQVEVVNGQYCVMMPAIVRQFRLERTWAGRPCFGPRVPPPSSCQGTCQSPQPCSQMLDQVCSPTPIP